MLPLSGHPAIKIRRYHQACDRPEAKTRCNPPINRASWCANAATVSVRACPPRAAARCLPPAAPAAASACPPERDAKDTGSARAGAAAQAPGFPCAAQGKAHFRPGLRAGRGKAPAGRSRRGCPLRHHGHTPDRQRGPAQPHPAAAAPGNSRGRRPGAGAIRLCTDRTARSPHAAVCRSGRPIAFRP